MRFGSSSFGRAVLFLYLPSMLMSLGQGMIVPALPEVGRLFGVSSAVAVQAITAQLIGQTLSLIPAGAAMDRWGTKALMVGGSLVAMGGAVVSVVSPNFLVLFASQFAWGLGMSAWTFGREFAAFDMVSPEQRGRQMSALMGIGSTGQAFGPAIGGVLTDAVGVRGLFVAYAVAAGVVVLLSLVQRGVHVQRPQRQGPMFNPRLFREIQPYFRMTYAILFLATFGQMTRTQVTNTMLPLYAQNQIGLSATSTGLLFSAMGVVTFAMIVPTGFVSDKLGRKWAAAPAAIFSAIGFIGIPFAKSFWPLAVMGGIVGIANGLALGAMTIYTFDIVPLHARGQLQAMRRMFGQFGSIVSPPAAALIATASTPGVAFWAFAPLHVVSAVLLIFFARESLRRREATLTETA